MAPIKQVTASEAGQENMGLHVLGVKTRSHITTMKKELLPKRKADESPLKRETVKRSALVDVKNTEKAVKKVGEVTEGKKSTIVVGTRKSSMATNGGGTLTKKPLAVVNANTRRASSALQPSLPPAQLNKKEIPKLSLQPIQQVKVVESKIPKPRQVEKVLVARVTTESGVSSTRVSVCSTSSGGVVTRQRSSLLEKSESSLYVSALEELNLEEKKAQSKKEPKKSKPPPEVHDFDAEMIEDLASVSVYAFDIFNYLKKRESKFVIDDYITRQSSINRAMRSLLVDWLVEIQENFELNHETLYLAVKLVDLFLCKVDIKKENLQLVGCTSLFVASKYEERVPPMVDDFIYSCDNLYTANEIFLMEQKILRVLDFQLGIPISYRFLRRYARCAKIGMELLTLARFILEYSLMDYTLIHYSDSKLAAAALYIAIIMKEKAKGTWSAQLEYYSGYKVADFKDIALALNASLHKKPKDNLKTIRTKYSHPVFFQVAKIPLVDDSEILKHM